MAAIAPGSLNLVLGHSTRMAKNEILRHKQASTVCIVSPSPRAARRMDDDGMTETFHYVGTTLPNMKRLEVHFYSTGSIWLPMKALSMLLGNSRALEFLLLNGMRLKGTNEDLEELSNVFRNHPCLNRMSFFNINSLHPATVPLASLLKGVSANPVIEDVALRYAGWAAEGLSTVTSDTSKIKFLRMSGKQTVESDSGGNAFVSMMEALKNNTEMREITLHQSVGPAGAGQTVADMLRHNETLEGLIMELGQFHEGIPIAKTLEFENKSMKKLDLKFHNTDPHKARPQIWTDLYGNTARASIADDRLRWDSEDSNDEDEETKLDRLARLQSAFEKALETNTTLEEVRFIIPGGQRKESYNILLHCKMNQNGWRKQLLTDDGIQPGKLAEFVVQHNLSEVTYEDPVTPIDVMYSILRAKPSLIALLIEEFATEDHMGPQFARALSPVSFISPSALTVLSTPGVALVEEEKPDLVASPIKKSLSPGKRTSPPSSLASNKAKRRKRS